MGGAGLRVAVTGGAALIMSAAPNAQYLTKTVKSMNLHEYQGKQLFAEYGLPVSKGYAVARASHHCPEAGSGAGGPDIFTRAAPSSL
jgi:succinyl-CoA synthetase beta subunit